MKKFLSSFVSALFLASGLIGVTAPAANSAACPTGVGFTAGSGSPVSPWEIDSAAKLVYLSEQVAAGTNYSQNKYFKLTADIDLAGCDFVPIGYLDSGKTFMGVFDGNGKSIRNLSVNRGVNDGAGLFGASQAAFISNLKLLSPQVAGKDFVGSVVGYGAATTLTAISVESASAIGVQYVGAIAGALEGGGTATLQGLSSVGSGVTGANYVGGLIGGLFEYQTLLRLGFRNGFVTQNGTVSVPLVGGLVGDWLADPGNPQQAIAQSFFMGNIYLATDASQNIRPVSGGLLGSYRADAGLIVSDSYFRGVINTAPGATALAGLVGRTTSSTVDVLRSFTYGVFVDQTPDPDVQSPANAFVTGDQTVSESFVDFGSQFTWETVPTVEQSKTFAELISLSTYTYDGSSYTIETSGDALRNGTTNKVWFQQSGFESGFPIHVWAFDAGLHSQPCVAGYFSVDGRYPCIPTPPGTYIDTPGSTADAIRDCNYGEFQAFSGQFECQLAPVGTFVDVRGATAAELCPVGEYQDERGQRECKEAPEGHYQDQPGQAVAIPCSAGTYQEATRSTACDEADPGFFVAEDMSVAQLACPTGKYQPLAGQDECLTAEAGNYVSPSDRTVQIPCEPGTYQDEPGKDTCKQAPAGSYQAFSGRTEAIECPVGTFQPSSGSMTCLLAEPGYFVSSTGSAAQTQCPAGTTSQAGASSCSPLGGGGGGAFAPSNPEPLTENPLPVGSGAGAVDISGNPLPVNIGYRSDARALDAAIGVAQFSFPLPAFWQVSESNALSVPLTSSSLQFDWVGLLPNSTANVYLPTILTNPSPFSAASTSEPIATGSVDAEGKLVLEFDLKADPGEYLLQISAIDQAGTAFSLVFRLTITPQEPKYWPKKQSENTVKLYAKNIVGAGKVQFFLNGREIAWVRAIDETDPKLRQARGAYYLVRTVTLVPGMKNVVEIHVDGERVRRAAYTLP